MAIRITADWPERIQKTVIVSPIINAGKSKSKEVLGARILKAFNFGWPIKIYILKTFSFYKSQLKNSKVAPFLQDYEKMTDSIDTKTLLKNISELFSIDWLSYLNKIKDEQILVVNSTEEDKIFIEQSEIVRQTLNNEKSMYITGEHEDFILKPDQKIVNQILDFLKN